VCVNKAKGVKHLIIPHSHVDELASWVASQYVPRAALVVAKPLKQDARGFKTVLASKPPRQEPVAKRSRHSQRLKQEVGGVEVHCARRHSATGGCRNVLRQRLHLEELLQGPLVRYHVIGEGDLGPALGLAGRSPRFVQLGRRAHLEPLH